MRRADAFQALRYRHRVYPEAPAPPPERDRNVVQVGDHGSSGSSEFYLARGDQPQITD
jgi:hypothetical protein